MAGDLTITGGRLVLPDREVIGDLVIERGVITAIGPRRQPVGEVIDATGCIVMPGVIDTQVHLREPEPPHAADVRSGAIAAALGGTTTVLGLPDCAPPITTQRTLEHKLEQAAERCPIHHGFFLAATDDNAEHWTSESAVGLAVDLVPRRDDLRLSPERLEAVLQATRRPVVVHAEDPVRLADRESRYTNIPDMPAQHGLIRDQETALGGLRLVLEAARRVGHPAHITSLSTSAELALVEPSAQHVTLGVAIHHLLLSEPEAYEELGHMAIVDPPLRREADVEALWEAVRDGRIDSVHSAHMPVRRIAKSRPYPDTAPGLPSARHLLPLLADQVSRGRLGWSDLVRVLCSGPARCMDLPRKGRLEVGYDGDVVIVDPERQQLVPAVVDTAPGWTPWAGRWLTGWPMMTVARGRPVVRAGELCDGSRGRPLSGLSRFS